MPSDIRAFFGGGQPDRPTKKAPEPPASKKRSRAKKVVEDDDDDEDEPPAKRSTPKQRVAPKPEILEETSAGDYFGKGSKPKRSEAVSSNVPAKKESAKETPKKANRTNGTPSKRSSARSKKSVKYEEFDDMDFSDDFMEVDEPVAKARSKATPTKAAVQNKPTSDSRPKAQPKLKQHTQDVDDDDIVDIKANTPTEDVIVYEKEKIKANEPAKAATTTKAATSNRKRASPLEDDEDEEDVIPPAKQKKASPVKKAPAVKKAKAEEKGDSAELKAIFDSIPTIEPPPPPAASGDKPKFQFGAHANSSVPSGALDTSQLPTGEDNCLAGLTFVFTGQLETLGREQGQSLVKQYGGKVQSAPSKKTSYVVLGNDAGPKKLQVIKDHSLKVINEQGLFELIKRLPADGGDSAAAEKQAEKRAKEEENIRKAAEEMEQQERARMAAAKPKPNAVSSGTPAATSKGKSSTQDPNNQLWTVRYAPSSLNQICGNKGQVEKLQRWLRAFPKNQRTKFKLPGPDGSGTFRAVMIHGPPGIGKTTAAHLVAKLEGYDIVESNASDTRSKKLVETGLKGVLSTTSLMGYFTAGVDPVEASKKKLVLIMDEVDGMSAGDRGGVGALAAICKKSQIPMILICNDRRLPKMKPFDFVTFDLGFRRPTTDMIRSRISTIAFREGLKLPPNVINALIEGSGADIRQVVNMISTVKLDDKTLDFEDGKDMSKAWEKHIVLKPWDIIGKILAGGLFNPASKSSLNDKQELYFNDHEFAPLMMQENYISSRPSRSNRYNGNDKKLKLANLQLCSKAAESISDGDLVDRMIHGSQQQWSLMPTHAMFSFVRPASFVYGGLSGQTRFASWLGKNSNQGKLMRFVKEIQGHMRLRTSADRFELRQTYIPALFNRLVKRLEVEGKEAVPNLIELMDWYYLTRDDWDAILELGVGNSDMETVKIESQAKSTFTRLYNQQSHPLPFIKASQVIAPKKGGQKERPDLEEALDESDEGEAAADDAEVKAEEDEELDLSKDKYVKQPKKKRAPAKGKKKAGADDEDEDEEDEKPKKGKGKAKAKK